MKRESGVNLKWDETEQIGVFVGACGQPATAIPPAALGKMVQLGRIPVVGLISGDGEVYLYDLHLIDERCYCARAIDGDTAGGVGCASLVSEPGKRPYCALNGRERCDPCIFDEPEDAPAWERIRAYRAVERASGR